MGAAVSYYYVGINPLAIPGGLLMMVNKHIQSQAAKGAKAAVEPVVRREAAAGAQAAMAPYLVGLAALSVMAMFVALRR